MATKAQLPSFLNFNRSISPSEGLMFGVNDENLIPVEVTNTTVRGTISSYSNVHKNANTAKSENIAKELNPKNANIQRIDTAYLPLDCGRIQLDFSVVVQANSLEPSGCNESEFRAKLTALSAAYVNVSGYHHLAKLYAWNLINGRVLWRNRFASKKSVTIKTEGTDTFSFNVDNIGSRTFNEDEMPHRFDELAQIIGDALSGKRAPLFLIISVSGDLPQRTEVYPSQEFVNEDKGGKSDKEGKVLSSIMTKFDSKDIRQATMHSQKIGNAIRVIDHWHGSVDDLGATAIEAFGTVQSRADALRVPGKSADVYKMLEKIDDVITEIDGAGSAGELDGNIHYLMAMLVRGGVFSGGKK
ncbi:type I-F CRISPR-associated protein Csy3 [Roseibium sp. RKSG952]|uniref:type I-F CRISPR-associated protein Csy3 n=1 Tax=Roseibium sp. RKSG952 TaxID=2529384 RepID=UPI0018AD19AD|nr:type I-F CRISPR-associated protein Csy3 [Roseibium sp. RKSG952]